ncbi:MAG: hypothetical protein WBV23_00165 [Desulfobaccales bacterium]
MTNARPNLSVYSWVCGFLVISLILYRLGTTTADSDLWGYLAFGRLFWEQRRFPYEDVFSYVPTLTPWVYHEWLTGVLFYPLYKNLGGPGLQAFKYAMGLATFWLIYAAARRREVSALAAGLLLAMLAGGFRTGFSPVRAQVFTYFFFALTLFVLENYRINRGRHTFLLFGLIFAAWANLHGGFVAGLGLIGLYALGEALARRHFRPYVVCLGLAVLVTLINPYGWRYWTYLVNALAMPRPEITEWASVYQAFRQGTYGLIDLGYVLCFALFSLLVIRREAPKDLTSLIILGVTFVISVKNIRNLPFFLLASGVYLPRACKYFEEDLRVRFPAGLAPGFCSLLMAFLLVTSLFLVAGFLRLSPFSLKLPEAPQTATDSQFYPVDAIRYLQDNQLSGNLLVYFDWGEYALWNLYPHCRVAIDGRYETVYPHAVCQEYFDFIKARGNWRQFLHRFPPDFILLPANIEIAALLKKESGWKVIYSGKGCILFQNNPG